MKTSESAWWKRTTVYQIYVRSFADSNGDGIGDLRGVIGKLDYLHELGVETRWLSPFFESPQADFGYDVSDHCAIAPEYGSLDDCRELIRAVHDRGMKIVFDMVLNHTSDEHPWFLASRSAREDPKRDWYIWRRGRGGGPPNNWRSMLGGSGWRYDEKTDEYYFASFLRCQPDLNYRNERVKRAATDVGRPCSGTANATRASRPKVRPRGFPSIPGTRRRTSPRKVVIPSRCCVATGPSCSFAVRCPRYGPEGSSG